MTDIRSYLFEVEEIPIEIDILGEKDWFEHNQQIINGYIRAFHKLLLALRNME